MRTVPRDFFERTEFLNHLECRIRRGRNLQVKSMSRRANLIQLSRSNRTMHDSEKLPPVRIPFLSH
jgi:hypothetical protein